MSRVGKQPITLPTGVTLTITDNQAELVGPKGTLHVALLPEVVVNLEGDTVTVAPNNTDNRAPQGLIRSLLANAVTGVHTGWKKELELHGVGMRAAVAGSSLNLNLGFSHPVSVEAPEGISFTVAKNVITVEGIDLQRVGETAATIRKLRPPEPYKGKGIRYSGEKIRRKAGKTGKTK